MKRTFLIAPWPWFRLSPRATPQPIENNVAMVAAVMAAINTTAGTSAAQGHTVVVVGKVASDKLHRAEPWEHHQKYPKRR